jgi:prevent-host-death family protein
MDSPPHAHLAAAGNRGHLRDVIDSAVDQGPRRITRHGKQAVIVVSEEEWNRRTSPGISFGDLLAESP